MAVHPFRLQMAEAALANVEALFDALHAMRRRVETKHAPRATHCLAGAGRMIDSTDAQVAAVSGAARPGTGATWQKLTTIRRSSMRQLCILK